MLGSRIKSLRKSKRFSQLEFGKPFDVSQQAIWKWETGKSEPDIFTLTKMADLFSISCDYLLGRTENENGYRSERNNPYFESPPYKFHLEFL